MRFWHKDLITILPRKQLISQWRECCAIAGAIDIFKSTKTLLVNRVLDYPAKHYIAYMQLVTNEITNRGYSVSQESWDECLDKVKRNNEIFDEEDKYSDIPLTYDNLFRDWHNKRYLIQCYCNLQEKYDCGGILEVDMEVLRKGLAEKIGKEIL